MISLETALSRVLAGVDLLPAETISLSQGLGRILAQDVAAKLYHPAIDVSAMDGYAIRAADAANTLQVIGESAAGRPFAGEIQPGQAVRIFTGAGIPLGADAVVMQEICTRDGDNLTISEAVKQGQFIRPKGLDFSPGQVLLKSGSLLGSRQIALAASMNAPWLQVRRKPRVAVLSTGDEIVMPGEEVGPGQLVSSNGPGLQAMLEEWGCDVLQLGIAKDTRESLSSLISAAKGCDLLVTSGGASVGEYDLVQDVLKQHGLALDFWKIAMRPGKPLMFGQLHHVPVIGLPGNPVSAMVCGFVFLGAMIRKMQGHDPSLPLQDAILGADVRANDERAEFMRGSLVQENGKWVATPFRKQDSAVVSGLSAADCLILRPSNALAAKTGERVQFLAL